jgi:hypothetical protein
MNGLHDDSVAGEHSRVDAMTAVPRFVFLVDVDNTLLDNDRRHISRQVQGVVGDR